MSDKKNKRVVLKIKKKPLLKRLEKIFTGKTNLDAAKEKLLKNPRNWPHSRPNRRWVDTMNTDESSEEIGKKILEDVSYGTGHWRLGKDPKTGEERFFKVTKPHYSELEQFPFKDDPVFANEQSSEYITEREKTRQFIKNVLKQNKKSLELPQSEGDQKIRKNINKLAEDIKRIELLPPEPEVYDPEDLTNISSFSMSMRNTLLKIDNWVTQLEMPNKIEQKFLSYKDNLDPEIRKKLNLISQQNFPDPSKPRIVRGKKEIEFIKKEIYLEQDVNTKLKRGYGNKLIVEARKLNPNFDKMSKKDQNKYLDNLHIQNTKGDLARETQLLKDKELQKKYETEKKVSYDARLSKKAALAKAHGPSVNQQISAAYDRAFREAAKIKNEKRNTKAEKAKIAAVIKKIEQQNQKSIRAEKAAGKLGDKMRNLMINLNKYKRNK